MGRERSLIPRKFRIGQTVETKSGTKGKVIGSAIYGYPQRPWVEYRIRVRGSQRTMYRRESELKKPSKR